MAQEKEGAGVDSVQDFVQEMWRLLSLQHLFYVTAMSRRSFAFVRRVCGEFAVREPGDDRYSIPSGFKLLSRAEIMQVKSLSAADLPRKK